MSLVKKYLLLLVSTLLVCSCALKETTSPEKKFSEVFYKTLAQRYFDYAGIKHWQRANFAYQKYKKKARRLEDYRYQEPENPKNFNMLGEALPVFLQARAYLTDILTPGISLERPVDAAKAQFSYDCWLEEYAQNPENIDTYKCRELFYRYLDVLYQHADTEQYEAIVAQEMAKNPATVLRLYNVEEKEKPLVSVPEAKQQKKHVRKQLKKIRSGPQKEVVELALVPVEEVTGNTDAAPKALKENQVEKETAVPLVKKEAISVAGSALPGLLQRPHYIYFPIGKDALDGASQLIIKSLVDQLQHCKQCMVHLGGHSDSSGSDQINLQLSMRRAKVVESEFIKQGVAKEKIMTAAYGSSGLPDAQEKRSKRFVRIVVVKK